MQTAQRIMGDRGEALVACSLEKAGFRLLARNYTKRFGEVDLIAERDDLLVFVEVKTRTRQLVDLAELVTRTKQKKIIAAAKAFLAERGIENKLCRFDVALVENIEMKIVTYIPDAFCSME